jgi:hypothetical protein
MKVKEKNSYFVHGIILRKIVLVLAFVAEFPLLLNEHLDAEDEGWFCVETTRSPTECLRHLCLCDWNLMLPYSFNCVTIKKKFPRIFFSLLKSRGLIFFVISFDSLGNYPLFRTHTHDFYAFSLLSTFSLSHWNFPFSEGGFSFFSPSMQRQCTHYTRHRTFYYILFLFLLFFRNLCYVCEIGGSLRLNH